MKKSLTEVNFVKRGDKSDYNGNCCGSFCNHKKLIIPESPDCFYFCTLHNIRVDFYDSCDCYLSMFDANPDLLKPFLTNCSEPKKKKNWFLRLFK